MRLLDRYVLRGLLSALGWSVAVLTVVLVLGNVFKQVFGLLVNNNLPLHYVGAFVSYLLPFSLSFTIPWGLLTAILLVFGRMSAANEITALRSGGVPVARIAAPVFAVALALGGLCLWNNLQLAPRAQENMRLAFYEIASHDPVALFNSDQVLTEFPGRKIYVGRKSGDVLENLHVYELGKEGEVTRVVYARTGRLMVDLDQRQLLLRLTGTRFEQRDESDPTNLAKMRDGITMEEFTFPISLVELYNKKMARRGLNLMTAPELFEAMRTNDPARRTATLVEANKRFSFALACVTFALVGIPLGITAQRKETTVGFALGLLVGFLYFLLIILADLFRNKPHLHPELLVWLPNAIFGALGIWLFARLVRR